MTDLMTTRRHMRIRRDARELAIANRDVFTGATGPVVIARCEHHPGGKSPKLAEATIHRGIFYFASRIAWRPDDVVQPRPWMTEHYLGAGAQEAWDRAMTDDAFLRRHMDQLQQPDLPSGERWIAGTGPHWVRYALPMSDFADIEALGLWVRCKDHPQHAEQLDALAIVEALRESASRTP
ncbi:hypothetical protein ACQ3I4_11255 [Zafaria sp. Z1313]|uniref:hypothetical protein n=1 Tax=Zafaria sp. Z1313 TaxID=3423202 RepID=UPI003D301B5B